MIAVIQRVSKASVLINSTEKRSIDRGFVVLLGITHTDSDDDIEWLSKKIVNLRVFADDQGLMNKSLSDCNGQILLISQFTLLASTKKGNRPSFIEAARPETAIPLYEKMIAELNSLTHNRVLTGEFGADMQVELINDGPVTITIDTKNKK